MMRSYELTVVFAFAAVACGNRPSDTAGSAPRPAAEAPAAAPAPAPAAAAPSPEQATPATTAPAAQTATAQAPTAPSAAAPSGAERPEVKDDGKPIVEVRITTNGVTMKFDVTKITAAPGQRVHVVLENKLPGALPHNWTLVRPGTEAAVAAEGLKKGPNFGYLAIGPNVLASSDMIAPGKTTEVTFNAPQEPGTYPYICTFPGHYMMMKGTLEVAP